MIIIEESIRIDSEVKEVVKFAENMEKNYLIWSDQHISFKCLKGNPSIEGSIFEQYEYFAGKKTGGKYRVKKVIPERLFEWETLFPRSLLGGKLIMEITPEDTGFSLTESITLGVNTPLIGPLLDVLIKKVFGPHFAELKAHQIEGLKTIKRLLEKEQKSIGPVQKR